VSSPVRSSAARILGPVTVARLRPLRDGARRATATVTAVTGLIPVAARPRSVKAWLRLGAARERAGRPAAATVAYHRALRHDPEATPGERALLVASPQSFPARRSLLRFVSAHLDELHDRVSRRPRPAGDTPARVFFYWAQGVDNAPAVVQLCRRELFRHEAEANVVLLDRAGVDALVDVPDWLERRIARMAHLSDVLRLELLWRYGGVWLDATCLPRESLTSKLPELIGSGFFAFAVRPTRYANWFLASRPGDPVVGLLAEAHHLYWEHHRSAIDYYVSHALFEALVVADREFRERWEASPRYPADPPHALQRQLAAPYDPVRFEELMAGCFVHKLTHKLDVRLLDRPTMAAHLLRW
jgi:hypothetical protein